MDRARAFLFLMALLLGPRYSCLKLREYKSGCKRLHLLRLSRGRRRTLSISAMHRQNTDSRGAPASDRSTLSLTRFKESSCLSNNSRTLVSSNPDKTRKNLASRTSKVLIRSSQTTSSQTHNQSDGTCIECNNGLGPFSWPTLVGFLMRGIGTDPKAKRLPRRHYGTGECAFYLMRLRLRKLWSDRDRAACVWQFPCEGVRESRAKTKASRSGRRY